MFFKTRCKNVKTFVFFTAFLLLFMSIPADADYSTNLVFSGYLQDGSGNIDVGFFSAPVVYDWDSDGKKDLLVGQKYYDAVSDTDHGYVSFYKNVGTNASPVFSNSTYIETCSIACNYLDVAAGG